MWQNVLYAHCLEELKFCVIVGRYQSITFMSMDRTKKIPYLLHYACTNNISHGIRGIAKNFLLGGGRGNIIILICNSRKIQSMTSIHVRTYVFLMLIEHMSWFYVIGLSFDKTHFTCIWIDLGCALNTSRNHVSRSSVEAFKSIQDIKQECKFIKA